MAPKTPRADNWPGAALQARPALLGRRRPMTPAPAAAGRLHGLDAVRGYALMLGVIFHATMSFVPGPQIWMVADNDKTAVLGAVFLWAHIFRMTTFFLIAGFFAHMTFHKRG